MMFPSCFSLPCARLHRDIDTGRLVVFGRSLGGAVAAAILVSHPAAFRAAILENTFTSIPDMASVLLPFLRHLLVSGPRITPRHPGARRLGARVRVCAPRILTREAPRPDPRSRAAGSP